MTDLNRRTFFKTGLVAAGATALPLATTPSATAVPHAPTVLASRLQIPWSLAFLPDGNALTGERDTRNVYRILKTGAAKQLVGTVGGGARRLFGLALSPNFATDRLLYAHVRTTTDARVIAMTYSGSALGTPRVIFSGIPFGSDHHGGGLRFSPDGQFLFVSVGDKGTQAQAQANGSLAGKILRIRPDGSIPADNPFGNAVWAKGFRNVEGMTFDGAGRLWCVEFGEDKLDELDQVVRGGNYGWPTVEGGDGAGPFRDPLVTWTPDVCSPAGVAIKNGVAYVGALRGERLWTVRLSAPDQRQDYFHQTFRRIRAVEAAPDGSIWFTTGNNDPDLGFPHVAADDRVVRFLP